jgi:probable F420-dependent oxidoreductase
LLALTAAAVVTSRLRLGTAVALLVQRDPITFAKEVATLDMLSGGRVELGVGAGWNRQEMRNHGTDPRTRITLLRERILAMKAIWTEERAEFHGTFVNFDPIYAWPKPVQRPHPPVWLAGWGATTFQRVLDHTEGWMAPTGLPPADLAAGMERLRRLAADQGRQMPPVIATVFDPTAATVREVSRLGVEHLLLGALASAPEAETMARLDAFAELRNQALAAAGAEHSATSSVSAT